MGRYLILWEMDKTRIPVDPKERGSGWKALMDMVKKGIEEGSTKDWGKFVGETNGYTIFEGTELEVDIHMQQYVPFAHFKVYAVASVSQTDQMIEALLK
ncbi:MAG: hypothetical protein JRI70_08750 [Deltaproteobacteria bacterium]|nr:hypothetical protein [Deltaproteobacteria bacterium]